MKKEGIVHTILCDKKQNTGGRKMTRLECSVKDCVHNSDNCCCKGAILVDGPKAREAEGTCCASFDENTGGMFTNLFKTPETSLEVACDAVKCMYNDENRCIASKIDISGNGACGCESTRCGTFKEK